MGPRSGSSAVEAALIYPLIILIIAGLISIGSDMSGKVVSSSAAHALAARESCEDETVSAEDIMRGRWIFR